ncbi:MAG: pseudouridine synthase, partial [Bacteroidota bacterium]
RRPKREDSGRSERPERRDKPEGKPWAERRPKREDSGRSERPERRDKPEGKPWAERRPKREDTSRSDRPERRDKPISKPWEDKKPRDYSKPKSYRKESPKEELIRLNKYIANSGVCSRREADKLIIAGVVRVNGKVVTELGSKVSPGDKVQYEEQTISKERTKYLLLNKPKGYITTVDDPEKRKTVMSLIEGACKERVYPVGRLDRNTTGLLLFTNDGAIAKKLTHPKYGVKKIYHVELETSLTKNDLEKIRAGLELEDGLVEVDKIEYIEDSKSKKELGVELHSGKNRVIRRIFEHLEYKVTRLDRVYYAGLTKKNLPRGHWRILDEQEVNMLKMIRS